MIAQHTIQKAVRRKVDAADPVEAILFRFHAPGKATNRLEQMVAWTEQLEEINEYLA